MDELIVRDIEFLPIPLRMDGIAVDVWFQTGAGLYFIDAYGYVRNVDGDVLPTKETGIYHD